MLELSDQEFKSNVINTLKALTVKGDNIQEHIGNVIRQMEI